MAFPTSYPLLPLTLAIEIIPHFLSLQTLWVFIFNFNSITSHPQIDERLDFDERGDTSYHFC